MEVPKSLMKENVKRTSKLWQNLDSANQCLQAKYQFVETSYINRIK